MESVGWNRGLSKDTRSAASLQGLGFRHDAQCLAFPRRSSRPGTGRGRPVDGEPALGCPGALPALPEGGECRARPAGHGRARPRRLLLLRPRRAGRSRRPRRSPPERVPRRRSSGPGRGRRRPLRHAGGDGPRAGDAPAGVRRGRRGNRRPPPRDRRPHWLAVVGRRGSRGAVPREARGRPAGLDLQARRRADGPGGRRPPRHVRPGDLPGPRRDLQGHVDLAEGEGAAPDRRSHERRARGLGLRVREGAGRVHPAGARARGAPAPDLSPPRAQRRALGGPTDAVRAIVRGGRAGSCR
jgi:hypothetical protein